MHIHALIADLTGLFLVYPSLSLFTFRPPVPPAVCLRGSNAAFLLLDVCPRVSLLPADNASTRCHVLYASCFMPRTCYIPHAGVPAGCLPDRCVRREWGTGSHRQSPARLLRHRLRYVLRPTSYVRNDACACACGHIFIRPFLCLCRCQCLCRSVSIYSGVACVYSCYACVMPFLFDACACGYH